MAVIVEIPPEIEITQWKEGSAGKMPQEFAQFRRKSYRQFTSLAPLFQCNYLYILAIRKDVLLIVNATLRYITHTHTDRDVYIYNTQLLINFN